MRERAPCTMTRWVAMYEGKGTLYDDKVGGHV